MMLVEFTLCIDRPEQVQIESWEDGDGSKKETISWTSCCSEGKDRASKMFSLNFVIKKCLYYWSSEDCFGG